MIRCYSLKEHEAVFLKQESFIFSIATGSISFVFCFRLNTFTIKIQLWGQGVKREGREGLEGILFGAANLDIPFQIFFSS